MGRIVILMNTETTFQVGDKVAVHTTSQNARPANGRHATTKVMEIARVGRDEDGEYYHLRRPGSTGKGGAIQTRPKYLSPA
jgi:predicted dithiol-disulfide oxidoreductase (DUF899 family)